MTDTTVKPEVVEHGNGILASADLMDQVIRDCESHTPGEAVYLRHVAVTLAAKARLMIAALDLYLVDVLEEPIDHAGWHYRKGTTKEKERFDHDEILRRLRSQVLEESFEAEHWSEQRLLGELAERIKNIYLSPSAKAKVGQLDRYGIPRGRQDDSVQTWEKGSKYIDVSPIQSQVQE